MWYFSAIVRMGHQNVSNGSILVLYGTQIVSDYQYQNFMNKILQV